MGEEGFGLLDLFAGAIGVGAFGAIAEEDAQAVARLTEGLGVVLGVAGGQELGAAEEELAFLVVVTVGVVLGKEGEVDRGLFVAPIADIGVCQEEESVVRIGAVGIAINEVTQDIAAGLFAAGGDESKDLLAATVDECVGNGEFELGSLGGELVLGGESELAKSFIAGGVFLSVI